VEAGPTELELPFAAAPPPPATLGELIVQYDPYCPGEPVRNPGFDYPGIAHVFLAASPELEPYLPFMHGTLSDDTGALHRELWHAPAGFSASIHAACGSWIPAVAPGLRTFTLEAEIIDRLGYEALATTADITCPECESPAMMEATGGTFAPVPAADAGPVEHFEGSAGDAMGCRIRHVASRSSRSTEALMLFVALAVLWARRRSAPR
jgi:hypothetical protein